MCKLEGEPCVSRSWCHTVSHGLELTLQLTLALTWLVVTAAARAEEPRGAQLTVCLWNLGSATSASAQQRVELVRRSLPAMGNPDVAVIVGLASADELDSLKTPPYVFSMMVEPDRPESRIGILCSFKPEKAESLAKAAYNIDGAKMLATNGFAQIIVSRGSLTLHLLAAALKNHEQRGDVSPSDTRRNEARQLKSMAASILKSDPTANILILAAMDDTPDKGPVKEVKNRRSKERNRFFDLRPADSAGVTWTRFDKNCDTYDRVDFAFCSFNLIPVFLQGSARLFDAFPPPLKPSGRPLLLALPTTALEPVNELEANLEFPAGTRRAQGHTR